MYFFKNMFSYWYLTEIVSRKSNLSQQLDKNIRYLSLYLLWPVCLDEINDAKLKSEVDFKKYEMLNVT